MSTSTCPTCGVAVDEHPASRCLDAWVELVIFGHDERYFYCPHFDKDGRMLAFCNCPVPLRCSTDISAAFRVINKLATDGLPCVLGRIVTVLAVHQDGNLAACMMYGGGAASHPPRDTFLWLRQIEESWPEKQALLGKVSSEERYHLLQPVRVQAKTPALAVCRAALMVKAAAYD